MVDHGGALDLDRGKCLELLASARIARVGLCMHALPVVLPMTFVSSTPPWDEEPLVVVSCPEGSELSAALGESVVALQVDDLDDLDDLDEAQHTGWSVLVQGLTRPLTDRAEIGWAEQLPIIGGRRPQPESFITLGTQVVRGHRFGVSASPTAW